MYCRNIIRKWLCKAISWGTFLKGQDVTQKGIILKWTVNLPTFTMKVLCTLLHNSQKRKMNFSLKVVIILKLLALLSIREWHPCLIFDLIYTIPHKSQERLFSKHMCTKIVWSLDVGSYDLKQTNLFIILFCAWVPNITIIGFVVGYDCRWANFYNSGYFLVFLSLLQTGKIES